MFPIVFGQDGDIISEEASFFPLTPADKRYSRVLKKEVFDFVGFVLYKNKLLTVLPKHFYENNEEEKETIIDDTKVLFNVIRKYLIETKSSAIANKYIGSEMNYESDYPFFEFFGIYNYYKKYGIYKEQEEILKKNLNGNVSWKDTIRKSPVVASKNGFIFLDLYSKKKNNINVFISQCMIYIINHTIKSFPYFFSFSPIPYAESKIDFLKNKEYTLRQLYQYKNLIFKDTDKDLIDLMIAFFEKYEGDNNGGAIHIKINYFDAIWEKMVNKYLNDYFKEVDPKTQKLLFNDKKGEFNRKFSSKSFDIDKSNHNFSIKPDHYLDEEKTVYIFDSKYYDDVNDLNYKQFAYNVLISNKTLPEEKLIYSALLLPGKKESKIHLDIADDYRQGNISSNYIIEQYLPIKEIMHNYLNLKN